MQALNDLGINAEFTDNLELPFKTMGAVKVDNQAQFNPMKFIAKISKGLNIYENTFIRDITPQENGEVSGRTAFDCAKMGDKTAKVVVEQYIRYVSYGLISILNIFQPSKILIGGGISKEGDYLLNPLREYVYAGDYNKYREKTKIETATLFNDAGIIGAALSVCDLQ